MSRHQDRITDLDRIAALGIRRLGYPANWERIERNGHCDWAWQDARMARLATLGIDPVLHLLHHGSGPMNTDLLDPDFPERFAHFAGEVAARYPWVTHYVPINEPVTTARFSALYGLWYPHRRNLHDFLRAVWHQVRAIQLAMRAIRQVSSEAVCLLTDDYGRVHSTPHLRDQAAFENERRWLALDLLFGQLTPGHYFWRMLRDSGISARAIDELKAEPLENAVVGIDYYLTSERFLDERLERYPAWTHGGNGRETYADIEAVRVRAEGIQGVGLLLREAWKRFGRPVAIAEAFLGAPQDDQARWLQWVWDQASEARATGIPVRSVTVWSLIGAYDWDSLVTRHLGYYEPGAFDLSKPGQPETDIAAWMRGVFDNGHLFPYPPGWWETSARLLYAPVSSPDLWSTPVATSLAAR